MAWEAEREQQTTAQWASAALVKMAEQQKEPAQALERIAAALERGER